MIYALLIPYFTINTFMTGFAVGSNLDDWQEAPLFKKVLVGMLFFSVGFPIYIIGWLLPYIKDLQLRFWWQFFFTSKWDSIPVIKLLLFNKRIRKGEFDKRTLENYVTKLTVRAVNRRFGLKPDDTVNAIKAGYPTLRQIERPGQVYQKTNKDGELILTVF